MCDTNSYINSCTFSHQSVEILVDLVVQRFMAIKKCYETRIKIIPPRSISFHEKKKKKTFVIASILFYGFGEIFRVNVFRGIFWILVPVRMMQFLSRFFFVFYFRFFRVGQISISQFFQLHFLSLRKSVPKKKSKRFFISKFFFSVDTDAEATQSFSSWNRFFSFLLKSDLLGPNFFSLEEASVWNVSRGIRFSKDPDFFTWRKSQIL